LIVVSTSVRLGLSQWGRNMDWKCSRVACWGKRLGLSGQGDRRTEKAIKRGAFCSVLLTKYHSGDKIKKNAMGKACGT